MMPARWQRRGKFLDDRSSHPSNADDITGDLEFTADQGRVQRDGGTAKTKVPDLGRKHTCNKVG